MPEQNGALIVTDGVFSMGGDIAKLPEICALAKKYGARVMVDDAHGLGVLGQGGRGTASYFGLEDQVDVYMGTFSKSLASLGGYMAADKAVAEYVRHNSRPFIFSASIPPANCATALAALRKLEQHPELPERLRDLSLYARKGFTDRGLKIRESALSAPTPIIPIYTYETHAYPGRGPEDLRPGRVCKSHPAPGYSGGGGPAAHQLHGHPHRGPAGRGYGHYGGGAAS